MQSQTSHPPHNKLRGFKPTIAVLAMLSLAILLLASQEQNANAATSAILPAGHTWEYTFTDPTGDSSWTTTSGTGTGGWTTGLAPFGNGGPGTLLDPGTNWPVGTSDVIVPIDSTKDIRGATPPGVFSVALPAGTYELTVAAGAWNAWDADNDLNNGVLASATGCPGNPDGSGCATGWLTTYAVRSAAGTQALEGNGTFETSAQALAAVSGRYSRHPADSGNS